MKRRINKIRKITKGMPSAVVLSIAIHAALFLLAGMLVVFTVVKKEEKKFVPPKAVERPKMKLKKPKVKVKKTSKPKPTTRIVTKINRASMPDIQLPEMSGMGEGLAGGIGGFDMMPDLGEVSVYGSGQSIGNDFEGTFYDFKRDRLGRPGAMNPSDFVKIMGRFVRGGWNPSVLSRYYRSPKKLYTTTFMVPTTLSLLAPEAFGEPDTGGWCWAAHYKGQLVHKDAITFRFWGMGDNIMVVRVNGQVVLNASWPGPPWQTENIVGGFWQSDSPDSRKYFLGNNKSVVGDWITLEPGVPLDMEVLIGEVPGGGFVAMLVVEVEGVVYGRNKQSGPILPMFKTSEPSRDLLEAIYRDLVPGEVCITNGPVFCDYDSMGTEVEDAGGVEPVAMEDRPPEDSAEHEARKWTRVDGKILEAKLVTVMGDKVVLKDSRGKQRKIPLAQLSADDRVFVELANPPKFNIDFSKKSSQRFFKESPFLAGWTPEHTDYVFSAKLEQRSSGEYNHELIVEFFAIGEEIDGDNYILFDRQETRFTPTKENGRSLTFHGDTIPVRETDIARLIYRRGAKYGGYLIVVTDSRGKIVDQGTSHKWLPGILGELRQLPLGKHFDKTGTRVYPPHPRSHLY